MLPYYVICIWRYTLFKGMVPIDIQYIVQLVVNKHKTHNPFEIAEAWHIKILYEPLGSVMGYHSHAFRQHFIHINQDLNEREAHFVCAHELGHIILHPQVNTNFLLRRTFFSVGKIERQANTFAVELLTHEMTPTDGYTIANCVAEYGIPYDYVKLRHR